MDRRALLSLFGSGVAALAGCTDRFQDGSDSQPNGSSEESPDGSPTRSPTDTSEERRVRMGESVIVDKQWLRVEHPRIRPTVIRDAGAWQRLAVPDGQYLVVDVTTRGPVPDHRDALSLSGAVDGACLSERDPVLVADDDPGRAPPEWERQSLAIPLPAASHESASVCWRVGDTTVHWLLSDPTLATLAAEPIFRVESLSARRTGDGVELDLTVANEGARDARFQARVSFQALHDDSSVVALDVPAGGTASYEAVPPVLEYSGVRTVTVTFRAGGRRHQAELDVAAPRTSTAARTTGGADSATTTTTDG